MLQKLLTRLGLTEKEAHIYETALEAGPETVQKIAGRAGITRTGAYTHIKSLLRQGLMSKSVRDKKPYFSAEPPENLLRLLETSAKEARQNAIELKKAMPQLRLLFETNEERPRIRVFEGREGLKSMVHDFIKSKFESVEEFVPLDEAYAFSPPKQNDYREQIHKKFKRIPMRILYTSASKLPPKLSGDKKEYRFLPAQTFPFSGSVTIYGNKVSLFSQKKTVSGVIIENQEIASTLRSMFNLAWEAANKYKN